MILPFRILAAVAAVTVMSLIALPVFWTGAAGAQGESEQSAAGAVPLVPVPRPEPGVVRGLATKGIRIDDTLTLPMPYAPPISAVEAIQAGESELSWKPILQRTVRR